MTLTASLVAEALQHMPPVTNLYETSDGTYYMVVVTSTPSMRSIMTSVGLRVPAALTHMKPSVSVFLADERGQVIDYDGDPANGLTPILSTNPRSFAGMIVPDLLESENPYADALAILGYELEEVE